MSSSVGVVGLGQIGGGIALALEAQGVSPFTHDADPTAHSRLGLGRSDEGSARAVAARSDVVLVAVVDDGQVREVIAGPEGILAAGEPPAIVAILSTVSVGTIAWAVETGAVSNVDVLDCGVSGGPEAAAAGDLVCLVGGERQAFERALPVLELFSSLVAYFGPPGSGIRAKLARNLVTYGGWLVAWEAAGLLGRDRDAVAQLAAVVRASDQATGGLMQLVAQGVGLVDAGDPAAEPGIPRELREHGARLAHKDLAAALDLARSLGLELPLAGLAEERLELMLGLEQEDG